MDIDYSSYLPEPTPLKRAAIIEYQWGATHFRMLCTAADVREEPWNTGDKVVWLHCKVTQVFDHFPSESEPKTTTTIMVPASYVTKIEPGPKCHVSQGKRNPDIGVFPPEHPDPKESLGIELVRRKIGEMMSPERN